MFGERRRRRGAWATRGPLLRAPKAVRHVSGTGSPTVRAASRVYGLAARERAALGAEPEPTRFVLLWALGSLSAGAEPRGTCLVPSGCSVTGLTRATCDARARPRGCARRGFSPNVSDRLLGSSGPALVAGRSRVDGGRSLLLRGAARAAHGPGEGRRVGQIGRPNHSRSQRVAIQMMPLLRRWQPPCTCYAQSQGSCTRGRARGGRRARLNLMPPCRLGPKSAEPNT